MGLYDMLTGKANIGADLSYVKEFFFEDETVISSYQFMRDSVVFTNLGIYMVDVQGVTGKKVEVKFFPKKNVKSVSYETAGNFDLDVDIKIGIDGNTVTNSSGIPYSAPISFKVPKNQAEQAREVIAIVKKYYLCY